MTAVRRTLLSRLIDYAGLFPPARLSLAAAVAEFAALRDDPAAWLLARFVCPVARAGELASLWGAGDGTPLLVAAIGAGGADAEGLLARTREDVTELEESRKRGGGVVVDQIELRLSADVVGARAPRLVQELVSSLVEAVAPLARPAVLLAVEAPVAGEDPTTVASVIEGIAEHNSAAVRRDVLPVAFKLRCGGLSAAAVPSTSEVAAVLTRCRRSGVAIKATQGLHHPIRRSDDALGTETHGFVNLLAAAALGRAHELDEPALAAILADGDPGSFDLAEEALSWRHLHASVADLAACRRHGVMSFGSCSFAEPREDLAALGWLDV